LFNMMYCSDHYLIMMYHFLLWNCFSSLLLWPHSTSLLWLNSISWLTPHLTTTFASFRNIAQTGGGQGELLCCGVVRCCRCFDVVFVFG
jgi:hypothetical protein